MSKKIEDSINFRKKSELLMILVYILTIFLIITVHKFFIEELKVSLEIAINLNIVKYIFISIFTIKTLNSIYIVISLLKRRV